MGERKKYYTLQEILDMSVEEISDLIYDIACRYIQDEGYSIVTAIEIATKNFRFWYAGDENKKDSLERVIYAKFE